MIRLRWARVVVAVLSIVLAACTGAAPSPTAVASASPTPRPAPDRVTFIEDFPAYGYWTPWYAGIDQGFFAAENIDLTVVPGDSSGDAASKTGAGAALFGLVDATTAIVAIANGTPITLVAAHWQQHIGGLCTIAERKVLKGFQDVVGLRIGAGAGSAYILMLPYLMKQNDLDPGSYSVATMTATAQTSALLSGQVDAIPCGSSTVASRQLAVKQQGKTMDFFAYADHGLHVLGHAIVVNNDVLKSKPDLVQRFMNAYAKSVVWSKLNPDQAVASYTKRHPEQAADGEKANYLATIRFEADANASQGQFYLDPAKLQQTVDLAKAAYDKTVDPARAYTNDFALKLPDALRHGRLP